MKKGKNLMVLGASGGVANAFLHHLIEYRSLFGSLVLVDKNSKLLKDRYIDHRNLDYIFLKKEIKPSEKSYPNLLKKHKIDIVLDITDMDTLGILEATNNAGVSYINTAMCDKNHTTADLVFDVYPRKNRMDKATHILCTGMNPGNVNMWVRHGIEKHGVPKNIIHFEYDTSKVSRNWHPMMTWSVGEFLEESIIDPGGLALGRRNVKFLMPNALENRESMAKVLKPIMKLRKYPIGMTVLHEENLSISYKYDIPSKFIYSVNPRTMERLVETYKKKGRVSKKDMEMEDNRCETLDGSDSIGVILEYPDKKVYYFNTIPNVAVIGTNATYTQVAIGIFSALFTLLLDDLKPGAYFVEDLFDTHYKYFMFDNMRVQEFVFKKRKSGMVLESYTPCIKMRRCNHFEHLYII
jgi:homospermidine synthase